MKSIGELPLRCPCCGYKTLGERGGYEICAVCFWEDDGQGDEDADEILGGPNGSISLTQGRENFLNFGASQRKDLPYVRKPRPDEQQIIQSGGQMPYLIESSITSPLLFELADGRFHIMENGAPTPFMAGHGYLLVEQAFADFLQQIEVERVTFEPAVLYSPVTGEELHSHVRIRVSQFFSINDISDLNLSGLRMLTLNDQYYFASPDLKDALEARSFGYISFSEGLSEFAAGAD